MFEVRKYTHVIPCHFQIIARVRCWTVDVGKWSALCT
jgi:hypothetical protein